MKEKDFVPKADIKSRQISFEGADLPKINNAIAFVLGIEPDEVEPLKRRIQDAQGVLRVFVHPNWGYRMRSSRSRTSHSLNTERIRSGVLRHMQNAKASPQTPPVLLMESERFVTSLREAHGDHASVFIMGSTEGALADAERGTFIRRVGGVKKLAQYKLRPNTRDKYMLDLKVLLHGLGVTKIVAGGMYLENDEDDEYDGLDGCLADVVQASLESGIKVRLSRYHGGFHELDNPNQIRGFSKKVRRKYRWDLD